MSEVYLVQSYTLGDCTVDIWSNAIFTVFHTLENTPCARAAPQDSDVYRGLAQELGYGDDTLRMCIEHELAHTLLAVARGLPWSPTLHAVAHGQVYDQWQAEENAVIGFQRICRLAGLPIINLPPLLAKGH